ncbi:hypothetical protein LZ198_15715 [Myxococcus sp. K15C18031901]|uniref:hypothetical protein n=1 Tax=Myxococcus dinghuensis TaxID=2906761 RepID=UPI0020A72404|nr:hypothetical protein [Myxococcus dinghuensis]MCP3100317.1 hypothetical protein [Myxococcus dinghuensis]
MANGQRRGGPGRSEETRVAPEEDDESTRNGPFPPPRETRMAPVLETRIGPSEDQEEIVTDIRGNQGPSGGQAAIVTEMRGGQAAIATELRPPARAGGAGRPQAPVATEIRGGGSTDERPESFATELRGAPPPPPRGAKVEAKGAGWLARGAAEKRPPPPPAPSGVVRLSPLEPVGSKAGVVQKQEEEGPALRTMFANHSALLAEQLRTALAKKMYGRNPHRVLRVDEPEGPSTAGGKLARQAISLVPRKGSGPSVVCGWVDVSKREAQLRNFEAVAKRYESHHGEPLVLAQEEYEKFLQDVEAVLVQSTIKVRLIVPEESPGARMVASTAQAKSKGVPVLLTLLLMGAAFLLGMFVGRTPG